MALFALSIAIKICLKQKIVYLQRPKSGVKSIERIATLYDKPVSQLTG